MKLAKADADLFFRLMWGLHFYVNQQHQILPGVKSAKAYANLQMEEKVKVRDKLWTDPRLIASYVNVNPDDLPAADLEIVGKWKRFLSGKFYVFRYLKKYTILIGGKSQVYGVLGLYDSLEDVFYTRPLPIAVDAVLLPFKGHIVHDGLLKSYPIFFGGGIRSDLKETYMAAKQNECIIVTLEPETVISEPEEHPKKPAKDWESAVAEIAKASAKLQGGSVIQKAAFRLLRASTEVAQAAAQEPDDLDALWRLEQRVEKALRHLQTVLDRAER